MLSRLRRHLEPSDDASSAGGQWIDLFDERAQPFVTTALLVPSFLTVHPLGGRVWLSYGLLASAGVFAYARMVPASWVDPVVRFAVSVGFCLCAGLVFGVQGWSVSMAILACGHVGVVWPPRVAIGLATLTVAVSLVSNHAGSSPWVWYGVLCVGLAVLPGLATQSRRRTLRLSRELLEQTQRTAESDARASALAERSRIARDIHDVLAHTLSGVSLQLDLADAQLEAGRQDEGRATVRTARGLVVDGLDEARRAVRTLRDGALDVPVAVDRMLQPGEELQASGKLDDLPAATAQETVRIVQEALTNARRHAQGAPTSVRLRRQQDRLTVEVINGPGTSSGSAAGSGMGLVGIRERVALLGGTCAIGPVGDGEHAGGWCVTATLPAGDETKRNANVQ